MAFSYSKPEPLNNDFLSSMDEIYKSMGELSEVENFVKPDISESEQITNEKKEENLIENNSSNYQEEKAKQRQYWSFMDEVAPIQTENSKENEDKTSDEDFQALENFGKSFSPSLVEKLKRDFNKTEISYDEEDEEEETQEEEIFEEKSVKKSFKEKRAEKKQLKEEKRKQKELEKEQKLEINTKKMKKEEKKENQESTDILAQAFNEKPIKDRSFGEAFRIFVIIVSVIAMLGSLGFLAFKGYQSWKNKKVNEQVNQSIDTTATWDKIHAKYPNINFPPMMNVKYADLYAQNQDFVGFVSVDGLGINLPVVQGKDDNFYLHHNFQKEKNPYGTAFLSAINSFPKTGTQEEVESFKPDFNTVIYSHSLKSGQQMFTNLKQYKDVRNFSKIPIIKFETLYKTHQYKIFAVFITNGGRNGDLNGYVFNYFFANLASPEKKAEFLDEIMQRRLYDTGVDVNVNDNIITLSTCTYEFEDARLVVLGRELRPGESTQIDQSKIKLNNNPRMPQAWYTKRGENNPFANSPQWIFNSK
ncbi:MAG: class B sortase [Clostridia bacterium]|nr:class B sortase [Clostridia bacterium]